MCTFKNLQKLQLYLVLKGCAENRRLFHRKFKIVRIGLFWRFDASGSGICMILSYSNGNLVMHFHKIAYIPWFHDTELWEWLGASPHNFSMGYFSHVPEPNYTNLNQFSTKNLHENLQEWLFKFLHKSFLLNLSSRLGDRLNFHFIIF